MQHSCTGILFPSHRLVLTDGWLCTIAAITFPDYAGKEAEALAAKFATMVCAQLVPRCANARFDVMPRSLQYTVPRVKC